MTTRPSFLRNAVLLLTMTAMTMMMTTMTMPILFAEARIEDPELNRENWADLTRGKTILLKFFTPWCSHCRSIADDWSELEEKYKDHEMVSILEINCASSKGDLMCEDYDIDGYPEIHYGDTSFLKVYDGEKDFDSFVSFVEANLTKPLCGVMTPEACPREETRKQLIAIDKLTKEYFDKLIVLGRGIEKGEGEDKYEFEWPDIANQAMLKNGIRNPWKTNYDNVVTDDDGGMMSHSEL